VDPEGNAVLPGPGRNRFQSGDRSGATSPRDPPSIPNSLSQTGSDITGRPGSKTTSAPTSPLKERVSKKESFLGKVSVLSQVVTAKVDQAKGTAAAYNLTGINKNRCFNLLVVDDQNTEWAKYFRGRKIQTDWDIRVEQVEFKDLAVSANSVNGVSAGIVSNKSGNKSASLIKPDFLLIRQNLRDAGENYKNLLLGFRYGGVPSINSVESIYNFQDKPWVHAHLLEIQRKVGKENFPLIEQAFYPNHKDMVHKGVYPCVFKIGHAHGGLGKVRVENPGSFQDLASVVAVSDQYCTVEEYIEAKYDLHVFKIGSSYKALMRKSLTGNWKTNVGQSILEEVPVQDKHKGWIDQVSTMFGGLALCSLEAVVGKDGKEYIIEVNDCAMGLLGESQEEDRRNIAEVVIKEMELQCKPPAPSSVKPAPLVSDAGSRPGSSLSGTDSVKGRKGVAETGSLRKEPERVKEVEKTKAEINQATDTKIKKVNGEESPDRNIISRRRRSDSEDSSASESSTVSESSNASSTIKKVGKAKQNSASTNEKTKDADLPEGEDTMKDLRTTFAGIFGEKK